MDKMTLRSLIIEMRNNGDSFQKISDTLRIDYGIEKTRQAICGMYNRIVSEEAQERNFDNLKITVDIINYAAIGLSNTGIRNQIGDISMYKITDVINNHKGKIEDIQLEHRSIVKGVLLNNEDLEVIQHKLEYKDAKPTKDRVKQLIKEATLEIMYDNASSIMAHVLKLTDDKALVNNIIQDSGIKISYRDVNKALNKF